MKSEVITWRVSRETKGALERLAKARNAPLAAVLDGLAAEAVAAYAGTHREAEQGRINREALRYIGSISLPPGASDEKAIRAAVRRRMAAKANDRSPRR
ncbi:MAG: hypothetical protein SFV18_11620 [Bryobacteraceae bacterium]|nr:hypothetical protein [Bryobacteraceae bacterium]